MEHCKHGGTTCDETCICTCDTCQEAFEAAWDAECAEKDMCGACGCPRTFTMEIVMATQHKHFFMPCPECKPGMDAFLAANHLCPRCRSVKKGEEPCVTCSTHRNSPPPGWSEYAGPPGAPPRAEDASAAPSASGPAAPSEPHEPECAPGAQSPSPQE